MITLEPACKGGGGDPRWIDWFLKENFNGECLTYQFAAFAKLQREGKITVETMGESGRWYQKMYETTPASAVTAHSAYDDETKNTVWYSSKYYRVNLFGDQDSMKIRDLHIFSENYPNPFEDTVCTENFAVYDTLPFIDGNRQSGDGILAGKRTGIVLSEGGIYGKACRRNICKSLPSEIPGASTGALFFISISKTGGL